MVAADTLQDLARKHLADARVLQHAKRYDAAIYLGGYAVELALKARICYTLNWLGYPDSNSEFQHYQSFRTHNLEVLLALSGIEASVKLLYQAEWSLITTTWHPRLRYHLHTPNAEDVAMLFEAIERLLQVIL